MIKLWYRSSYRNTIVAARTRDGEHIAVVAGKHERYYPYFHQASEWDNLLVHAGGVGYALSARDIIALRVDLDHPAQTRARIAFAGRLRGTDGQTRALDFELCLALQPGKRYGLGKLVDWSWLPGLRWQPYHCMLRPERSRFVIDGKDLALQHGWGELERGELRNLTCRWFAFRYDYDCLVQPDSGCVRVRFATRALTQGVLARLLLDPLLCRTADLTLRMGCEERAGAAGDAELLPEVLVEDRIDLGLALLDRQLVTVRDRKSHVLVGLRERFHARGSLPAAVRRRP